MLQPAYSFLGYNINEIKYINNHKENTYVGISILDDTYIEATKQYYLIIRITSDFSEEESSFVFQAAFQINDVKWFNELDKNSRKSIFFGMVFPFVRERVFAITSDSNPGLFIPTLNVKNINFEKELKLIRTSTKDNK